MFFKFKKIFIISIFFVFPSFALAGPSVSWSGEPTVNANTVTGFLTVSGIDAQTPPLILVLFSDSNEDFSPYQSYAILGPASNNTFNFTTPSGGNLTYFLPVLDGNFDGSSSFNPFTAYSVGQIANISTAGYVSTDNGAGSVSTDNGAGSVSTDNGAGSLSSDTISFQTTTVINNPLGEGEDFDILGFLQQLFENFVKIALPFLVLFAIWSGLQFVLARGNEEKLSKAKENFLYVIIGTAIVFGAWGLAELLSGTVDQFEAMNFAMKLLV